MNESEIDGTDGAEEIDKIDEIDEIDRIDEIDGIDEIDDAGELPVDAGRRRGRALVVLAVLLGLPLLVLGIGNWWFQRQLDPPGAAGAPVEVTIEAGWSVGRIGDELARHDIIDSTFAYTLYTRFGGHSEFAAGTYELRVDLGIRDAVAVLEAGPRASDRELAIIPGLWLDEVAAEVESQLGLDAARFVDVVRSGAVRSKYQPASVTSTEGLLFPDTYRIAEDATEADVVATMVARFDEVADQIGLADAAASSGHTPYEVAITASLIQGEARLDSDRPLIASVVYNRLRDGTELQIDATVLYAIGERKSSNTAEDRATESPYNTYFAKGLPPTPIATIAEVSLAAALHPAVTEYRFYVVSDSSGAHAFAVTYEEHLANVDRARELGLLG